MGDNLPDFANMSEEETMRWLESLATRQGVDRSELTTSADMDVPEIDPETADMSNVGPGYVPSESFSRPLLEKKGTTPVEQPVETYDEEQEQPTEQVASYSAFDEQVSQLDETPVLFDAPASPMATSSGTVDLEALAMEDPMAFLQALAARQGANPNEFVQAGAVDVPEIDPETADMSNVGPGYVPSETFSFSSHAKPAESFSDVSAPEVASPEEPEVAGEPTVDEYAAYQSYDQSQYAGAEYATDQYYQQPTDDAAAYQGYDQSQYAGTEYATDQYYQQPTDDASTYQDYDYSQYTGTEYATDQYYQQPTDDAVYQGYDQSQYAEIGGLEQPAEAATTPSSEYVDSELSAEIDPIKWLESLAARQGATEGFTTEHDLYIPEIDPETADMSNIGPGYTPYDAAATTSGKSTQKSQVDEYTQQPISVSETSETLEPETESASLSWLEDLAADQGADVTNFLDELTTESEALPGFDLDFDASGEEATSTLASVVQRQNEMDILAGMSDEDIARAQADGTITPEQELAWLMQKAKELEELHEVEDAEYDPNADVVPGEVPDWLKEHMPDADELAQLEQVSAVVMPPFDELNLPQTEDVDWLSETTTEERVDLILEDTSQMEAVEVAPILQVSTEVPKDNAAVGDFDPWAEDLDAEYEMRQKAKDQEPDWYAEAVEKVEQEIATEVMVEVTSEVEDIAVAEPESPPVFSESTVPDWLQETTDEPIIAGIENAEELPDWLRSDIGGDSVVSDWLRKEQFGESDGDIDWLPPEEPVIEDTAASIPDWLQEVADSTTASPLEPAFQIPIPEPQQPKPVATAASVSAPRAPVGETLAQGVDGALPSWYSGTAPLATPQPVAAPAPPPTAAPSPPAAPVKAAPPQPRPQPQRVAVPYVQQPTPPPSTPAVVPQGEQFVQYRQTLEQNPSDHETRLKLARELEKHGSVNASLEHYETLIESSASLDSVAVDLVAVSSRLPAHPKVRRLLGDTYMRQGRLQEALDTYRGALNQL